jgi:hypothetical protein
MNQAVLDHVSYRIGNARVNPYPFPHFFAENVFPEDYYAELLESLPPQEAYEERGAYNGRKFAEANPERFELLRSDQFLQTIGGLFWQAFQKRFGDNQLSIRTDTRLILDSENYSIGPHTDAPWKIVSLLFYLPRDRSLSELGTSVYFPKEKGKVCAGGPHYPFEQFNRVHTAPFIPNSCFGFFKTANSWHGVEPITIRCRRDVLLWNLYDATRQT